MTIFSNVTGFLQSRRAGAAAAAQPPEARFTPAQSAVLRAVERAVLLPLSDVSGATGLAAEAALPVIEALRQNNIIEVAKLKDARFLRLTEHGQTVLKGQSLAG